MALCFENKDRLCPITKSLPVDLDLEIRVVEAFKERSQSLARSSD